MRLDHIAYRVKDRHKAAEFFQKAFGYKVQTEFDIKFDDGETAKCIALEPPEKNFDDGRWTSRISTADTMTYHKDRHLHAEINTMHLPPEIFISDGTPDSIVGKWVERHGPGIHHLAYQVESVQGKMDEWKEKGYAEFTTENPLTCPDLTQVFTKPSELTGVVYEFIERGKHGFCADNVKNLMLSSDFPQSTIS